jgi:hypothetical protein
LRPRQERAHRRAAHSGNEIASPHLKIPSVGWEFYTPSGQVRSLDHQEVRRENNCPEGTLAQGPTEVDQGSAGLKHDR